MNYKLKYSGEQIDSLLKKVYDLNYTAEQINEAINSAGSVGKAFKINNMDESKEVHELFEVNYGPTDDSGVVAPNQITLYMFEEEQQTIYPFTFSPWYNVDDDRCYLSTNYFNAVRLYVDELFTLDGDANLNGETNFNGSAYFSNWTEFNSDTAFCAHVEHYDSFYLEKGSVTLNLLDYDDEYSDYRMQISTRWYSNSEDVLYNPYMMIRAESPHGDASYTSRQISRVIYDNGPEDSENGFAHVTYYRNSDGFSCLIDSFNMLERDDTVAKISCSWLDYKFEMSNEPAWCNYFGVKSVGSVNKETSAIGWSISSSFGPNSITLAQQGIQPTVDVVGLIKATLEYGSEDQRHHYGYMHSNIMLSPVIINTDQTGDNYGGNKTNTCYVNDNILRNRVRNTFDQNIDLGNNLEFPKAPVIGSLVGDDGYQQLGAAPLMCALPMLEQYIQYDNGQLTGGKIYNSANKINAQKALLHMIQSAMISGIFEGYKNGWDFLRLWKIDSLEMGKPIYDTYKDNYNNSLCTYVTVTLHASQDGVNGASIVREHHYMTITVSLEDDAIYFAYVTKTETI